jgi:hypothetical protein
LIFKVPAGNDMRARATADIGRRILAIDMHRRRNEGISSLPKENWTLELVTVLKSQVTFTPTPAVNVIECSFCGRWGPKKGIRYVQFECVELGRENL